MKKKLLLILSAMQLFAAVALSDTENLIIISANGVKTTYAFSRFRSASIESMSGEKVLYKVNFTDGTPSVGNLKLVSMDLIPDEPQEDVEVTTGPTSATFTWPAVPGAATYQLIIYKDASQTERFCTLTFNSAGQLINIDFNPSGSEKRKGSNIFSFTVTGLEENKDYKYDMRALGSAEQVLEETTGSFETITTSATQTEENKTNIYTRNRTIVVDCDAESTITFFDTMGHQVGDALNTTHCEGSVTLPGVYIVSVNGNQKKIQVE